MIKQDGNINNILKLKTYLFGHFIYLYPCNVVVICEYLLTSYCNDPFGTGFEWFEDLINNILLNSVNFKVFGYFGMASNTSKQEKFTLFLKFIGKKQCFIPLEYFLVKNIPYIHEIVSDLINYENNGFLNIETKGLKGEIVLNLFKYDNELNKIIYPSIYIITLIRRFIEMIIMVYTNEISIDNSSIYEIKKISKILEKFVNEGSGKDLNSFPLQKRIIKRDLIEIIRILDESIEISELYNKITILWNKIASECFSKF